MAEGLSRTTIPVSREAADRGFGPGEYYFFHPRFTLLKLSQDKQDEEEPFDPSSFRVVLSPGHFTQAVYSKARIKTYNNPSTNDEWTAHDIDMATINPLGIYEPHRSLIIQKNGGELVARFDFLGDHASMFRLYDVEGNDLSDDKRFVSEFERA